MNGTGGRSRPRPVRACPAAHSCRIGVNHLLNMRRSSPQETAQPSLDEFGEGLADGLAADDYRGPDAELLYTEVRLQCSQAMLQCLTREERLAYVLCEVFELESAEAAWICDITPSAHRKRLERARRRLGAFLTATCARVSDRAWCRCSRRVEKAVSVGRLDPDRPVYAAHPVTPDGRTAAVAERQMIDLHAAAAIFRTHPDYAAPGTKTDAIAELLSSGRFPMLA